MKRIFQTGAILLFCLLLIWFAFGFFGAWVSTQPRPVDIGAASEYFGADYPGEELALTVSDGEQVAGWYIPNNQSTTAVIILAGIGGNRVGMVERAKIYLEKGFGVLLPDLQGTGESEGRITFGWEERLDLLAAVDFLQQRKVQNIGVHGCSLGAATISYTLPQKPPYQFVVLESPYDNIVQALKNRVEIFGLPLWLFQPLIWCTEWRLGVDAEQLAPEDYVHLYSGPTFLLAGDSELKVKKTETEKIFQAIGTNQKQLYFFAGAKHEDFLRRTPEEYQTVLGTWIEKFKPIGEMVSEMD